MCATVEDMLTLARADEGQFGTHHVNRSISSTWRPRFGNRWQALKAVDELVWLLKLHSTRAARGCSRDPGTREEVRDEESASKKSVDQAQCIVVICDADRFSEVLRSRSALRSHQEGTGPVRRGTA